MKTNKAGDVRFGDYVRHLQSVCRNFQQKVAFYKAFCHLAKRQPKKFRLSWRLGWVFYEERDSEGFWHAHNAPFYINDGKDNILSFRLYDDAELKEMESDE